MQIRIPIACILIAFIALLLCPFAPGAQPVLTSLVNMQAGDSFVSYSSQLHDPGPAGANQIWDFSAAVSSGAATAKYIHCPASEGADCIIEARGGSEHFYFLTETMQAYDGFNTYTPSGSVFLDLEDMKEILRFPFTYGDSYMDYYSGLFFWPELQRIKRGL